MADPTAAEKAAEKVLDLERERKNLFTAAEGYLDGKNRGNRASSKFAEKRAPLAEYTGKCDELLEKGLQIIHQLKRTVSLEKAYAEKTLAVRKLENSENKSSEIGRLEETAAGIAAEITASTNASNSMTAQFNAIQTEVHARSTAYINDGREALPFTQKAVKTT